MATDKRIRLLVLLVVAALAAALLGACGDSGSTGGPDQFRDRTKSPLLDFGEEGSGSELEQAEEAVNEFLVAHSKEDWETVCDQLSESMLDKIERLATTSTGLDDTSCPAFLNAFAVTSPQQKRAVAEIEGGSLRHRGAKGYLIYSGPEEAVYAMPLSHEGDEWKIALLAPRQLS